MLPELSGCAALASVEAFEGSKKLVSGSPYSHCPRSRQQRNREECSSLMLHLFLQIIPVLCCREGFPDSLGPRNGSTHCLGVLEGGPPRLTLKAAPLLKLLALCDVRTGLLAATSSASAASFVTFAFISSTSAATFGVIRVSTALTSTGTSALASQIFAAT